MKKWGNNVALKLQKIPRINFTEDNIVDLFTFQITKKKKLEFNLTKIDFIRTFIYKMNFK